MSTKDHESLWADVREWLSDATRSAIREAEDLTRRGKLKLEIMNLSSRLERRFAELGGRIYEQARTKPETPVPLAPYRLLIADIAKLEAERTKKRAQYEAEKRRRGQSE
ncbi:MAG TPA: hypothetical protein ENN51_05325 [candidate division WOR-3 bacterium]|uniref:Uncharacterized protein n=1 Tax=candidate division WOR-3 bacterium TaxID=2052148 RepID=A0A7V0T6G0_UNCW3|nr:hypothetical protein [candidate division WOR-3 bacterium]